MASVSEQTPQGHPEDGTFASSEKVTEGQGQPNVKGSAKGLNLGQKLMVVAEFLGLEGSMTYEQLYLIPILQTLGMPLTIASLVGLVSGPVGAVLVPVLGYFSDRRSNPNRRKLLGVLFFTAFMIFGLVLVIVANVLHICPPGSACTSSVDGNSSLLCNASTCLSHESSASRLQNYSFIPSTESPLVDLEQNAVGATPGLSGFENGNVIAKDNISDEERSTGSDFDIGSENGALSRLGTMARNYGSLESSSRSESKNEAATVADYEQNSGIAMLLTALSSLSHRDSVKESSSFNMIKNLEESTLNENTTTGSAEDNSRKGRNSTNGMTADILEVAKAQFGSSTSLPSNVTRNVTCSAENSRVRDQDNRVPFTAALAMFGFIVYEVGYDQTSAVVRAWILACSPHTEHTSLLVLALVMAGMGMIVTSVLGRVDFGSLLSRTSSDREWCKCSKCPEPRKEIERICCHDYG